VSPGSAARTSPEHAQIPALDGLRAIAVAGVILFHIYKPILPGGFTGVDVFFVISGFLITSIILHDIHANTFSFREFYLRRIQRLLPNATTTVAVTILLLTFFLPAGLEIFTARHGVWTLFNLSNIYTWIYHGSYWDGQAEWAYLTHFWSLGIEEQFYLLFPLALFLFARFTPKKIHFWLLAAFAASFVLCLWGTYNRTYATFYLLPTRIWELLLGAFLAAAGASIYSYSPDKPRLSRGLSEILGWSGIILILLAFIFASSHVAFPGWIVLLPTFGAAMVLLSIICGKSTLSILLSTAPFVGIGKVSYSLYLWHWPFIIFGKMQAQLYEISQDAGAVLGGIGGVLAGILAYFTIERPLRKRGPGRVKRLAVIAVIFTGTLTLCLWNAHYKPFKTFPQFDPIYTIDAYEFHAPENTSAKKDNLRIRANMYYDTIPINEAPTAIQKINLEKGGLLHLHGGQIPRVFLWGNSHANMYAPIIDEICRERKISVAFFGKSAAPPSFLVSPDFTDLGNKSVLQFNEYKIAYIKQWEPDVIFIIERLEHRFTWEQNNIEIFEKQITEFLSELKPLKTKVVFVAQIPVAPHGYEMNFRAVATFLSKPDGTLPVFREIESSRQARNRIHQMLEKLAAKHSNLQVIRPDLAFINPDKTLHYAEGRNFFYLDDNHLSGNGAKKVRPLFEAVIAEPTKN
jgi:peptidoglycan/LPS O-acetylase OafA/YrhL